MQRRYEILPNRPVSLCPCFAKLYVATGYAEQRRYRPAPSRIHSLPCNGFLLVCNEMWQINHGSITLVNRLLYFNVCMHACLFLITRQNAKLGCEDQRIQICPTMNNVAASPHEARLGVSTKKQGTGEFPCWQAGGLANPRGREIWWKTDPHSPSLFFLLPHLPFSAWNSLCLFPESAHHRTFGVCFILTSRGAQLRVQASLCPLSWPRFIPGFSLFFSSVYLGR